MLLSKITSFLCINDPTAAAGCWWGYSVVLSTANGLLTIQWSTSVKFLGFLKNTGLRLFFSYNLGSISSVGIPCFLFCCSFVITLYVRDLACFLEKIAQISFLPSTLLHTYYTFRAIVFGKVGLKRLISCNLQQFWALGMFFLFRVYTEKWPTFAKLGGSSDNLCDGFEFFVNFSILWVNFSNLVLLLDRSGTSIAFFLILDSRKEFLEQFKLDLWIHGAQIGDFFAVFGDANGYF